MAGMLRTLNVFLACLGLVKVLSRGLLMSLAAAVVQPLVGAGTLASGPGVLLLLLIELLIIGLPLAWWWRSRRPRWLAAPASTGMQRAAHGLLGVANALWLLSLALTLFGVLITRAAPAPWLLALFRPQGVVLPLAWGLGLALLWWQARRTRSEDPAHTAAGPDGTPATDVRVSWGVIALRAAVVLIYLPLAGLFLLVAFGALLAGARHANVGGAMMGLLGVGALLLVIPFGVFVPRHWRGSSAWHGVGALVAILGMALAVPNLWDNAGQPWLRGRAFERQMATVQMGPPRIEPLRIGEVTAGLRTRVVFRLSKPIRLTSYDHDRPALAQLLSGVRLVPASGTTPWPFEAPSKLRISQGGVPLPDARLSSGATLEAGEYQVEFDTWLTGLRQYPGEDAPCVSEGPREARSEAALAAAREVTLRVEATARSEHLRAFGRRVHRMESAPLVHAYDHADWLRQLAALPLERCVERDARQAREREAAAARKKFEDYLAGRAPWNDNPLYQAVCAHDPAEVRRVLALGTPRMAFSGMLSHCGIDASKPEIFDLLFPLAQARAEDRDGYCRLLLQRFLVRKDEASLGRLRRLGLPVACGDYELFQWLLGYSSEHPIPAEQRLPWLRRLTELGMDPCLASPSGLTLLQRAAHYARPEYLEFLLDAGCDPAALQALDVPTTFGPPFMSAQLAWLMRVRGYWRNVFEQPRERLPPEVVERLSRRIGDVSQHELTRFHPKTGVGGPLLITEQREWGRLANLDAALIAWMGSRGLRMDAANSIGLSWYARGYKDTGGQLPKGHDMLDSLSVEQLRQLIKPVNLATGKPGKPLEAAKDMSQGGLGEYLCRRGAIRC